MWHCAITLSREQWSIRTSSFSPNTSLNQYKGLRLRLRRAVSATPKRCVHHPCDYAFHSALCCTAYCPLEFSKEQLYVNEFCVFRTIYLRHFQHDFHAQGVTLKGKSLATKWMFQDYSELLNNFTRPILKTAEKSFCAKCTSPRYSVRCHYGIKRHMPLLAWMV